MKTLPCLAVAAVSFLFGLEYSHADITYGDVMAINESAAGVRAYDATNVILTGSRQVSGVTQGLVWLGSLQTGVGAYYNMTPQIEDEDVTTSLYYGPNTELYDPSLGTGNIRFVGSYQNTASSYNHGLIYSGSLAGDGVWQPINVLLPDGETGTVANTIPHSTMGDLVVGNYDLTVGVETNNAFIYNINTNSWTIFDIGDTTNITSAYGVWQNGTDSTSYTIIGGTMHEGINKGYLINYDTFSESFGEPMYYDYLGGVTHFEGITGVIGGYNLIATTTAGATFGFVPSDGDTYGSITWTVLDVPDSTVMTANTIVENIALGVYSTEATEPDIQTYTATVPVPEPSVNALLAVASCLIGFVLWRRRSARI